MVLSQGGAYLPQMTDVVVLCARIAYDIVNK